jgi:soluble lytic murein transglycosylase-like protein
MGALRIAAVALALVAAAPAAADPVDRWQAYVEEASLRFGVPVPWIERVIRAESGGQTSLDGRPITSPAGAMGLMQLMPGTWAAMRARLGLGPDPHQPRDNILAGTFYLRMMYERFGYPGLFAAYNAGPGRYAEHLASGRALPTETRFYVAEVAGIGSAAPSRSAAARTLAPPQGGIFFATSSAPARTASDTPDGPSPLFLIHR